MEHQCGYPSGEPTVPPNVKGFKHIFLSFNIFKKRESEKCLPT
jgi:hypothetical protein